MGPFGVAATHAWMGIDKPKHQVPSIIVAIPGNCCFELMHDGYDARVFMHSSLPDNYTTKESPLHWTPFLLAMRPEASHNRCLKLRYNTTESLGTVLVILEPRMDTENFRFRFSLKPPRPPSATAIKRGRSYNYVPDLRPVRVTGTKKSKSGVIAHTPPAPDDEVWVHAPAPLIMFTSAMIDVNFTYVLDEQSHALTSVAELRKEVYDWPMFCDKARLIHTPGHELFPSLPLPPMTPIAPFLNLDGFPAVLDVPSSPTPLVESPPHSPTPFSTIPSLQLVDEELLELAATWIAEASRSDGSSTTWPEKLVVAILEHVQFHFDITQTSALLHFPLTLQEGAAQRNSVGSILCPPSSTIVFPDGMLQSAPIEDLEVIAVSITATSISFQQEEVFQIQPRTGERPFFPEPAISHVKSHRLVNLQSIETNLNGLDCDHRLTSPLVPLPIMEVL